jgi:hypothetical protein
MVSQLISSTKRFTRIHLKIKNRHCRRFFKKSRTPLRFTEFQHKKKINLVLKGVAVFLAFFIEVWIPFFVFGVSFILGNGAIPGSSLDEIIRISNKTTRDLEALTEWLTELSESRLISEEQKIEILRLKEFCITEAAALQELYKEVLEEYVDSLAPKSQTEMAEVALSQLAELSGLSHVGFAFLLALIGLSFLTYVVSLVIRCFF